MLVEKTAECCTFALAALDGLYGWASEIIAIALVVFVFNFLTKKFLKRLHLIYEKKGKIWKDSFVRALYDPLSYFVWIFAIIQCLDLIASRIYHEMPIQNRHMFIAIAASLCFSWFLFRWKNFIVRNAINHARLKDTSFDAGKIEAVSKLVTVIIIFFTILVLMEVTHSSLTTILAFSGVGGLAVAIASQEIVANFFGGFMIYVTRPFSLNDWIQVPNNDIEGYVEHIGWYMTRIRSLDKRPIYIPNSIFTKQIIITPSRMTHRQIKEVINIRCEDLSKMRTILPKLREMVGKHPDLDPKVTQLAYLSGFGPSSIDVTINLFTNATTSDAFMRVKEDVLLKITELLAQFDADLALPTQNISILNEVKLKQ